MFFMYKYPCGAGWCKADTNEHDYPIWDPPNLGYPHCDVDTETLKNLSQHIRAEHVTIFPASFVYLLC